MKSNLNEIYCEITGDITAASSTQEQKQPECIAQFLASSDKDGIITDLWELNGKKGTKFKEFWDDVNNHFSEYEASLHGSFLYLPFAISIRELVERIKRRKPEKPVPSEEMVRLQFAPKHPHHRSALSHTGRFDITFQVQRWQMRSHHANSKYVFHQQ